MYGFTSAEKPQLSARRYTRVNREAPILGISRALSTHQVPPRGWLSAHNAVIRDGTLQKCGGWTAHTANAEGSVNLIQPIRYTSGQETTLIGTNRRLYRLEPNGALTQLNPGAQFKMSGEDCWRTDYLDKAWWLTSIADGVYKWGATTGLQLIDTRQIKAKLLVQYANHIFLGNILLDDPAVKAYVQANAGDADGRYCLAASSNARSGPPLFDFENDNSEALVMALRKGGYSLREIRQLGEVLACYTERTIHRVNYTAQGTVYEGGDRNVIEQGLMAARALIASNQEHTFPGTDDFYRFSGAGLERFGVRIWQWWQAAMADAARALVWALDDQRYSEQLWGFQPANIGEAAQPWQALVYSRPYDAFTTRDFPFRAAGLSRFPNTIDIQMGDIVDPMADFDTPLFTDLDLRSYNLLAGDEQGRMFRLDEDRLDANGADLTMVLESGDCDEGTDDLKSEDGCDVDLSGYEDNDGENPLVMYVAPRLALSDALTWRGPHEYNGTGFDYYAEYRYIRRKFVQAGGDSALRSYAPRVKIAGRDS